MHATCMFINDEAHDQQTRYTCALKRSTVLNLWKKCVLSGKGRQSLPYNYVYTCMRIHKMLISYH